MGYPIYETFYSWQGEGVHLGKSAFFIRLFGCPVHCPWCDSAGTWHRDYVPERVDKLEAETLAKLAAAAEPELVVVTGGEPLIHDLESLTAELGKLGLTEHLSSQRSNGLNAMVDRIKKIAEAELINQ